MVFSCFAVRRFRSLTIVSSLLLLSSLGFAQEIEQPGQSGLSLEEVLKYAETHAPVLKTAEARTRIARAGVIAESPWFPENPQVSGSIGSRSQSGSSGVQVEFSLAQEIEIAGERGMRKSAAQADEKLEFLTRDSVRWDLHVEVHRLYNELILMEEKRRQAERFVAFSESLQKIAASQVRAGETAPLTLLVADADLAQTRSELLLTEQQEAATKMALAGILGWPASQPFHVRGTLPEMQTAPEPARLLHLMAENHPSLHMRRQAVIASETRLKSERRVAWPNPTVGATYAKEPALPGQPSADIWMFNLNVPLPLWRRNQGGVAKAQAELDVAVSQQAELTTQLETQLRITAGALNAAAARVAIYEQSVIPKLEEKLGFLQKAYELGEVDLLQVSQTRERLLEGTRQYLDAKIAYFRAAAALEGYVGIDWTNVATSRKETRK